MTPAAFAQEPAPGPGGEAAAPQGAIAIPKRPRVEDHFWRRKVVNRIDLTEKINMPLIRREHNFYTDNSQFSEKEGLVMALFNGLKAGKYVAYHPDSLNVPLSYEAVMQRIQEMEGSLGGGDLDGFDAGFDEGFDAFDGEGDGGEEDLADDEWGFAEDEFSDDGFTDEFGTAEADDLGGEEAATDMYADFDPGPFENVIHFVEDRIFDRTRSDMIYDIQLIEIIWTDPGETLPEKSLCVFRYPEVLQTLENAQWKNRFNDAEYKTLREVFELRLFHSFILNVSGDGVNSLQEAERRRQKLVEFEHHLWSY